MENTEAVAETTTNENTDVTDESNPHGAHAVLAHKDTGVVSVIYERTKTLLTKKLNAIGPKWAVLGAFKGRQLKLKEKVSFSLN